jgi:uncharacterized protein YxeA
MSKVIPYVIGIPLIIIILLIVISLTASFLFKQKVNGEVKSLLSQAAPTGTVVQESDLQGLPPCVQKWMMTANVVGKERITSVMMTQKGLMRTLPNQPWMEFSAQQYVTIDKPGFIWSVEAQAAPLMKIVGRDKYYKGNGEMLIKLLGLVPVANAAGPEVNQGSMLRYLAESIWYPSAALSPYIQWTNIDTHSAKATMNYENMQVSGIFHFNDQGEPVNFTAQRYRETNGKYELATWSADVKAYKEFDGRRIPTEGTITWKLNTGDFTWYKLQVVACQYNITN